MLRTYEAITDEQGSIRLIEPLQFPAGLRVLVTLFDERSPTISETTLFSEPALAEEWNMPEEDEAWSHLQQVLSS